MAPAFPRRRDFLWLLLCSWNCAPAAAAVVLRRPQALNLTTAPYVDFVSPTHGECHDAGTEIAVRLKVVFSVSREEGEAFMTRHAATAEVCIAIGVDGAAQCVRMSELSADMAINSLGDGCHTVSAWWQDKHALRSAHHPTEWGQSASRGVAGAVMSVVVVVGAACEAGCTAPPGSLREAYQPPPNSITGGCLGGGGCGDRCAAGCCEATTPFSVCVHPQSAAAANDNDGDDKVSPPLPLCSDCLAEVSPPRVELLPRFSAGIMQRHLRLVRETVLHSAFEGPMETQDFDSLTALTMVGRRRFDHLNGLIQDVLHRGVKGDIIELGCWRGGVALFAAAAVAVYETARPKLWWHKYATVDEWKPPGGGDIDAFFGAGGAGGAGGEGDDCEDGYEATYTAPAKERPRLVWLADSFDGLPPVDLEHFPGDASHADTSDSSQRHLDILRANSVELVQRAAEALEVADGVRFLKGFFNDTLPAAIRDGAFGSNRSAFSILRLDGDLYQSTLESLHYLYPLLSVGGHVVIDDFTDWEGCRRAVADFRAAHGIRSAAISEVEAKGDAEEEYDECDVDDEFFLEECSPSPPPPNEDLNVVWHDVRSDPARKEYTRGVWWTKQREVHYDPMDSARPVFYARDRAVRLPPASSSL